MTSTFTAFFTIVVPAIAYFAGYAYLDGYFETFDVSLQEVSPGLQTMLAHGGNVYLTRLREIDVGFWATLALFVMLLPVAATLFVAGARAQRPDWPGLGASIARSRASLLVAVEAAVIALALYVAVAHAHDLGTARAEHDLTRLNPMKVVPAKDVDLGLPPLYDAEKGRELRHLTTTADTVFGVVTFKTGGRQWVVRIPKSSIVSMRVYQD